MRRATPPHFPGRRVERQPSLHKRIQQHAEGPGVGCAAVVGLAQEDLGGGVVFAAAAGGEELGGVGDFAGEAEVREGD
jgi:hypothetical protein